MKMDQPTPVDLAMKNPKIAAVVRAAQEHMAEKHAVSMTESQVIELLDRLERAMREAVSQDALEQIILAMFGNGSDHRSH